MLLYNAGLYTSNFNLGGTIFNRLTDAEKGMRLSVKHYLESYHYIGKESFVKKIRADGVKVFLDSGAFSAFTKGVQVDLPTYCDYVKRNADIVGVASVLDAIGDHKGTFINQKEMELLGVVPLPCYHFGEPVEVLDFYVSNYPYITIGGMVGKSPKQLKIWLDRIWEHHLTHPDGTPKLKVHGFGLTSLPLMMRYPWWSVDSSTWVQWAANGSILVPDVGQISISSKSSARRVEGMHLDTIAPIQREHVESVISGWGFDPQRLRDEYISRWAWNCWAFPYYAKDKQWEGDRFVPEELSLF